MVGHFEAVQVLELYFFIDFRVFGFSQLEQRFDLLVVVFLELDVIGLRVYFLDHAGEELAVLAVNGLAIGADLKRAGTGYWQQFDEHGGYGVFGLEA